MMMASGRSTAAQHQGAAQTQRQGAAPRRSTRRRSYDMTPWRKQASCHKAAASYQCWAPAVINGLEASTILYSSLHIHSLLVLAHLHILGARLWYCNLAPVPWHRLALLPALGTEALRNLKPARRQRREQPNNHFCYLLPVSQVLSYLAAQCGTLGRSDHPLPVLALTISRASRPETKLQQPTLTGANYS